LDKTPKKALEPACLLRFRLSNLTLDKAWTNGTGGGRQLAGFSAQPIK
jgi:hypothetical protein